jgi:hypothetical protein
MALAADLRRLFLPQRRRVDDRIVSVIQTHRGIPDLLQHALNLNVLFAGTVARLTRNAKLRNMSIPTAAWQQSFSVMSGVTPGTDSVPTPDLERRISFRM